ncbi:MAG: hypothetical protein CVT88_06070 [Candidatus Altiarchaeales archaeon HGW-Altiarchaeales-1]|nr:MAG: hypothetical protein CVT88_06070 [Candidatus Altiarchaeales archaeon HGW-Altiarchaeales-1]
MQSSKSNLKHEAFSLLQDVVYALAAVLIIFGAMYLLLGPPFPPIVVVISTSMLHEDTQWKNWFEENNLNYTGFPLIGGFDKGDVIITKRTNNINIGDVVIYERDLEHYGSESAPIIHRAIGIISIKDWKFENYSGTLDCINENQIEEAIESVKMCNEETKYYNTNAATMKGICPYKNFPKEGNFKFYITKGDNNPITDQCGLMGSTRTSMRMIPETQVITNAWILIPKVGYIKIWLNDIISFVTSPFRGH